MENENMVSLDLRLTRRNAVILLSIFFVCWQPRFLGSETFTMTTYYPAPYGGYASLLTTGQTILARDSGLIGVGTNAPAVKLDVKDESYAADPEAEHHGGRIRITGDKFPGIEFSNSGNRITGAGAAMMFATSNMENMRIDSSGAYPRVLISGTDLTLDKGYLNICHEVPYGLTASPLDATNCEDDGDRERVVAAWGTGSPDI